MLPCHSGILLLAELLTRISSKPLENATIHSLIGFFAERLVSLVNYLLNGKKLPTLDVL